MTGFRRLSERTGARPPEDVPYEGVPEHLRAPLAQWIVEQIGSRSRLLEARGAPATPPGLVGGA